MWRESPGRWSTKLKALNEVYLGTLSDNFELFERNILSLEQCRESLRESIQNDSPDSFTMGTHISIHLLLNYLLTTPSIVSTAVMTCSSAHTVRRGMLTFSDCLLSVMEEYGSLQDALDHRLESTLSSRCRICEAPHIRRLIFTSLPALLVFDLSHQPATAINHHLVVTAADNIQATYALKGILYYANFHFTSRFITHHNVVWYHDGIHALNEGPLDALENLSRRNAFETVTAVIYAKND